MVERINELCKKWEITVKSLEKVLGLGNGTIRRWDESSPSLDKVVKVAHFFGITVSELIGEIKEARPLNEDELDMDILNLLSEITPSERAQVFAFVQGLKANHKA